MSRTYIKSSDITVRLLNECLRPNAVVLAEIMLSGELACVIFEPNEANAECARLLGWDGIGSVFVMAKSIRESLATTLDDQDQICAAWLREDPADHVFVLIKHGLLLVNYDRKNGLFHLVDPPEVANLN